MADKDLYAILGVARDATADEIKAAYRKLARQLHPDVNPGDKQAEERFKELSAASEILSDPEKRSLYDELGADAAKIGFDPEKAKAYREWKRRAGAGGGPGGFDLGDLFSGGGGGGIDLGDLFGDLFGGGGRSRRETARRAERGGDIEAEMRVTLADVVRGAERELAFARPSRCSACKGSGARGGDSGPCTACGGKGRAKVARGPLSLLGPCLACNGSGRQAGPACDECGGSGETRTPVRLKVRVPIGIEDGQVIRLAGQGLGVGSDVGDLLVKLHVEPHPWLERKGADLWMDLPITVPEALRGANVNVPTFDGEVALKIPAGAQNGLKLRLRGRGIPAHRDVPVGDLYARLVLRLPDITGAETLNRVAEELEPLYTSDVRASLVL